MCAKVTARELFGQFSFIDVVDEDNDDNDKDDDDDDDDDDGGGVELI